MAWQADIILSIPKAGPGDMGGTLTVCYIPISSFSFPLFLCNILKIKQNKQNNNNKTLLSNFLI